MMDNSMENMESSSRDALFRRISLRIMPILFLAYAISYMDFYNVAFAQLQMTDTLGMSDRTYGLGVTALVIGQVLFMIPSNLALHRFGARLTLIRVLVAWFVCSICLAFVQSPVQYIIVRIITGMLTAGLFTGMLLYITYWFPPEYRARTTSVFMLSPVVAGMIVGPLSGWIIASMDGWLGLFGWQWMFIVEAIPAAFIAALVPFMLADRPASAHWLTPAERSYVEKAVSETEGPLEGHNNINSLRSLATDPRLYLFGLFSALTTFGIFAGSFFLPLFIRDMGVEDISVIGMIAALPYVVGGAVMLFWSRHSDRTQERRWHTAGALALAATGFSILAAGPGPIVGVIGLICIVSGLLSAIPCFWPIPPTFMHGPAAAAGIAAIVVIGDIGGALAPPLMGHLRTTGHTGASLMLTAALLIAAAFVILLVARRPTAAPIGSATAG
jgi:MFS family permease